MEKIGANMDYDKLDIMSSDAFETWLRSSETRLDRKHIQMGGTVVATVDVLHPKILRDCIIEPVIDCSAMKNRYVSFENCEFKSKINLRVHELQNTIEFRSCSLISIILYCEKGGVIIKQCHLLGSLKFNNLSQISSLNVSNTIVEKNIRIDDLEVSKYCQPEFENVVCHGEFYVDSEVAIPVFYVRSGNYSRLRFNNSVQSLYLGSQNELMKIKTLDFTSYTLPAEITVENVELAVLQVDRAIGKKTNFEFIDTIITNVWRMTYSIPANLVTFNMDLTNCEIYFDNSLLLNCTFSNITWPNGKVLHSVHKEKGTKNESLRETYRQLKQAMLKDGNNIDALAFYRNEMEAYRTFVKDNPEVKFEDKFILFISWFFSNHGQSLWRPITGLFVIHFVLLLVLVISGYNGFKLVTPSQHDWVAFSDLTVEYWGLIYPTHKFGTMTGFQLFVDFVMRLFSGFFIYQIIRASRKFAKV